MALSVPVVALAGLATGSSGLFSATAGPPPHRLDRAASSGPAAAEVLSLWADSAVPAHPAEPDPTSVELGVRFRTDVPGAVLGVRFYQGAGGSDGQTGSLWDASGHRLAGATLTGDAAAGWRSVRFPAPVPLTAGNTYVASHHTQGRYAADQGFFTSPYDRTPLHADAGVYSYGATTRFPASTFRASNYYVDVLFAPASPVADPPVAPPSTPPVTPPVTPGPGPVPPPPPAPQPGLGGYVQPGSVGYRGNADDLTTYDQGGAALPGCTWKSYGMRCDQDDLTIDHAHIVGGLYWTGSGNLTITNSVIEGGDAWYGVYAASNSGGGSTVSVTDSTLRWRAGSSYPAGFDAGLVWVRGEQRQLIIRCDLSGTPQGLAPTTNSVVDSSWIHDLSHSTPAHVDGVFSQGGSNITLSHNYVDAPLSGPITAANFWQNLGGSDTGGRVIGNFLRGGAYTLYDETMAGLDVEDNTFGGGIYGDVHVVSPGSIGTWSGNVHPDGSAVARP